MNGKRIVIAGAGPASIGAVVDLLHKQGISVEVGDRLVATQANLGLFDCMSPGMATDSPF